MDDFTRWSTADESQFLERKSAYQRSDGQPRQRKAADVAWDIAETLSAMANADGGELVVGVENDGLITGVPHPPKKVALLLDVPRSANYVRPPLACSVREVRTGDDLLLLHFSADDRRDGKAGILSAAVWSDQRHVPGNPAEPAGL